MNPTYIKNIVNEYLTDPLINGAIFINGEWGSGKTHFLKEYLFPFIRKQGSTKELKLKEDGRTKNFRPIYISLNGLTDTKTIISQILSELFMMTHIGRRTNINKYGKPILAAVQKINLFGSKDVIETLKAGIDPLDLLIPVLKKTVLCFDDLERISDKVSFQEVLGFINIKFVEHNHIKTLIIGDERHIEYHDKRTDIKEKIFWRELVFELGAEDIYSILKERFKEKEFSEFITNEREIIISVLSNLKINNLRTIIFSFDILGKIFSIIEKKKLKMIRIELMGFIMIISKKFKENKLNISNYLDDNVLSIYNQDWLLRSAMLNQINEELEKTYNKNNDSFDINNFNIIK